MIKKGCLVFLCLLAACLASAQQYELKRAKELIDEGKYTEGARILRPLAEGGNAEAQYLAAGLFLYGDGVMKSREQAEKYYLLAARQGYTDAALELCSKLYEPNQEYEKAASLLDELCKGNQELQTSPIGVKLGKYYYYGQGVKCDKELGWMYMFLGRKSVADGDTFLESLVDEFYTFVLDKYKAPEKYESLYRRMAALYYNHCSYPKWCVQYLDDMLDVVRSWPEETQRKFFALWDELKDPYMDKDALAEPFCDGPRTFLTGIMYCEGIGVEANLEKGRKCMDTEAITWSWFRNALAKYENCPKAMPEIASIWNKRKAALELEERKKNISVTCSVPQTNAQLAFVNWENGMLEVCFRISNKAMNASRMTAGTARYKGSDGKYRSAKAKLAGSAIVKHGETVYLSVTISNMPSSGSLSMVQATLSCQYGQGYVYAHNVVW